MTRLCPAAADCRRCARHPRASSGLFSAPVLRLSCGRSASSLVPLSRARRVASILMHARTSHLVPQIVVPVALIVRNNGHNNMHGLFTTSTHHQRAEKKIRKVFCWAFHIVECLAASGNSFANGPLQRAGFAPRATGRDGLLVLQIRQFVRVDV